MATARLLDLSRLASRLGRGPLTGVDRVEQAYLTEFLAQDAPVFGLVRTALGFLLLDRAGMDALRDRRIDLGSSDLPSRLAWRKDPLRGRAETGLRRLAIARSLRGRLARMLRRHLPADATYFNVGHADLDLKTLGQIRQVAAGITVLLHDTIPLDYPGLCRLGTAEVFQRKMRAIADKADVVIYTTQDARQRAEAHLARLGRVPKAIVANLGVPLAEPAALTFAPRQPYFVCLGTIEPRKNHAMLLDVWEKLPAPVPALYIIGGRGWASSALLARLDALPEDGPVQILSGLGDAEVATLLQGARALLFPSLVEGFGIPALEAAALGTPLILSNLAVFKEILPHSAVYLEPEDSYSWLETIARRAVQDCQDRNSFVAPSWAEHFNKVLTALALT
jgi:glycosyltransferase involved in cell wall biosynthesis